MTTFRDDAGNRYFAANVVAEDSWLREHESYEWFVRGVEYAASQTLAIPALAVCAPEDLYYAVRTILRGAGLPQPTEIARLARELDEARALLEQYQRLVVFADSVARARGDACGLCDALGRDDQPYQSHRAADLIAEAERALTARRGEGGGE